MKKSRPLFSLLLYIALEVLANAVRKGTNRCTNWEEKKLSSFSDDMIVYVENRRVNNNNRKLLSYTKILIYNVNPQKSIADLYTGMKNWNLKVKIQHH